MTSAPAPVHDIETTLHERFRHVSREHAGCLAVVDGEARLTYGELDAWSDRVAAAVQASPGCAPVTIALDQGAACVAAILGILKAGRAYVPLDVSAPRTRLRVAVADVGAELAVTDGGHGPALAGLADIVDVDAAPAARPAEVATDPGDPASVFFTSGTTGRPKGVVDTHRNVLHNVLRYTLALDLCPDDRLTLLQAPSFSGTVSSLFGALLNGAAVFPVRPGEAGIGGLARLVRDEELTVYHSVPSIFRSVVSLGGSFPSVRVVRLEGDRAASTDVELWRGAFGPGCVLANGLGATETGLVRQLRLRPGDTVAPGVLPVGYPVEGVDCVIVDRAGRELPPATTGELEVRSRYLAIGYRDRPELTAAAFRDLGDGVRAYRTGDVGRMEPDGCITVTGRADALLEVAGRRIDPAEIETVLLRQPEVSEAVVTALPGRRGEGRLVAYLVPAPGGIPPVSKLRRRLARELPAALVPGTMVTLERLPTGAAGKVDRFSLPSPPPPSAGLVPPVGELEARLVALWARVLERPVGPLDDFFELGGDSLAAAEIAAAIEELTGVEMPTSALLETPTVRQLAARVCSPAAAGSPPVVLRRGQGPPLVLLHGLHGDLLHYARIVRALPGERAVWGLEWRESATVDLAVETVAARHLETLLACVPADEPLRLAGFCFGGVVAFEMARQARAQGRAVESLALLGISPFDFPGLVSREARAAFGDADRPTGLPALARWHAARLRTLPLRRRPAYIGRRALGLARRLTRHERDRLAVRMQAAFRAYRPSRYDGAALLVLARDTSAYADDLGHAWAGLAAAVDIRVVPGDDYTMLRDDGVAAEAAGLLAQTLP